MEYEGAAKLEKTTEDTRNGNATTLVIRMTTFHILSSNIVVKKKFLTFLLPSPLRSHRR